MTKKPDDVSIPPQDKVWAQKLADAEETSLKDVRAAAEGWSKTIAALLAVFGAVAIVGGPKSITDVTDEYGLRQIVAFFIIVAAGAALVSTYYAALSAQGVPTLSENTSARDYRAATIGATERAIERLRKSRGSAILAAVALLAAFALSLGGLAIVESDSSSTEEVRAVAVTGGAVECGELAIGDDGIHLLVAEPNGTPRPVPLADATSISAVGECPAVDE